MAVPAQAGAAAQTGPATPAVVTPPAAPYRAPWRRVGLRLRRATRTAPGRLRLAVLLLLGLLLVSGAATAWQAVSRGLATDRVVSHSEPLSQDAAEIYRSLADADTTAAANFLLAGNATAAGRQRYQDDLAKAADLLARAAARTDTSSDAQHAIATLNQQLPQYSALVATAVANDRQGLPLGGAYLRYASGLMQGSMLGSAKQLVQAEGGQLDADYRAALGFPVVAAVLGVLVLAALVRCQVLLLRRTNRVFNLGLLGATAAVLVTLGWLATAATTAQSGLDRSRAHAALPLRQLDQLRLTALQARTAEYLDLVARGASDTYTTQWDQDSAALAGKPGAGGSAPAGALLDLAGRNAPAGVDGELAAAAAAFRSWDTAHKSAADANHNGDYDTALRTTVDATAASSSATAFATMDTHLARAATIEQAEFRAAAQGVGGWWYALAGGAAVLTVLGAAGVVLGLGRRLAEYR
ncbi:hypothetical protein [Kitasatospora sp. MMS16-BH015]|uniref:hypothetical protein n=1 Tax=Kitasatospora sp. MMS16-BH015 TaxID=2018025 RepID=UPI000CF2058B|nr:hypothetical protein [Kitasatospora sp. MMS16-BH015]